MDKDTEHLCRDSTNIHLLWHEKQSSVTLELTKRLVALERRVRELEDR